MDSRKRNGDAHVPGHSVMTHEDGHRAIQFVQPDWRVGAGANLERAPLHPVPLSDHPLKKVILVRWAGARVHPCKGRLLLSWLLDRLASRAATYRSGASSGIFSIICRKLPQQ